MHRARLLPRPVSALLCSAESPQVPPYQQRQAPHSASLHSAPMQQGAHPCSPITARAQAPFAARPLPGLLTSCARCTGYFSRYLALRQLLLQFLGRAGAPPAPPLQLLSLGAGFDTTYFQLQVATSAPSSHWLTTLADGKPSSKVLVYSCTEQRSLRLRQPVYDMVAACVLKPNYANPLRTVAKKRQAHMQSCCVGRQRACRRCASSTWTSGRSPSRRPPRSQRCRTCATAWARALRSRLRQVRGARLGASCQHMRAAAPCRTMGAVGTLVHHVGTGASLIPRSDRGSAQVNARQSSSLCRKCGAAAAAARRAARGALWGAIAWTVPQMSRSA